MQLHQSAQSGFKRIKTSRDVLWGQTVVGVCKNSLYLVNTGYSPHLDTARVPRLKPCYYHIRLAEGRRAFGLVHLFYGWLSHCAAGWNCVWRSTITLDWVWTGDMKGVMGHLCFSSSVPPDVTVHSTNVILKKMKYSKTFLFLVEKQ